MKFSGEVLSKLRQDRDYSLGKLSRLLLKRCGHRVTRSAISQWEHGKTCPKLASLLAVAKVFQVDLVIFFEDCANNQFVCKSGKEV
jgi:transcriptional regulator with XRE-family HTH domain